jgi:HSP20 family molecular chaperone IbpA
MVQILNKKIYYKLLKIKSMSRSKLFIDGLFEAMGKNPITVETKMEELPLQLQRFLKNLKKDICEYKNEVKKDPYDENFYAGNSDIAQYHITENDGIWMVEILLPGIQKENIKISVTPVENYNHCRLDVKYQEKVTEQKEQQSILRKTSYHKYWLLCDIDVNSVTSVYKDGILKVTVNQIKKGKPEVINIEVK